MTDVHFACSFSFFARLPISLNVISCAHELLVSLHVNFPLVCRRDCLHESFECLPLRHGRSYARSSFVRNKSKPGEVEIEQSSAVTLTQCSLRDCWNRA